MSDSKVLHNELRLWASADSYTFEPKGKGRTLTIDRRTGELYLNAHNTPLPTQRSPAVTVYGIFGIISLATCDFLIVITNRQHHGQLLGHDIYRATDFKVLPISSGSTPSHLLNHPVEKHLLSLVHSHLNSGFFWFSYTWDLTRRVQAQWVAQEETKGLGMWESVDQRFFWNSHLHAKLVDASLANPEQDLSQFILPVVYGTFVITSARINNQPFQFCLISRRSRLRAGTRYMTRGIDDNGHVANFNETEQIVILRSSSTPPRDTTLSFVQTRGSVPAYWAEVNTLRYKPDLQVMDLPQTVASARLHLEELTALYGSQQLVNLVNQKGYEKPVKEAYERNVKALNMDKVKYEYFDFHNECKNMRWDRIELLIDRIRSSLDEQGYFHHSAPSEPVKLQLGTVRTNCMDNLDRTNVVQSSLAKWSLTEQLRAIGVLQEKERVDDHPEFMSIFRNVWADHADDIAMAYAGSGALKADFTRTGVRSRQGLMKDGYNSMTRYFKNNFFDGPRQDAFDLMTGAWVARRGPGLGMALLLDQRPLVIRAMPYILSFAIFMLLAGLTLPRTSDYSLTYYFAVWLVIAALTGTFIAAHGIQYVSWPKLNPRTNNIWYDGAGFRSGQHGKGFNFAVPGLKPKLPGIGISPRFPNPYQKYEEVEMGTKKRTD